MCAAADGALCNRLLEQLYMDRRRTCSRHCFATYEDALVSLAQSRGHGALPVPFASLLVHVLLYRYVLQSVHHIEF